MYFYKIDKNKVGRKVLIIQSSPKEVKIFEYSKTKALRIF